MSIKPTEHQMNEYFARIEKETRNLMGEKKNKKKNHESKEEKEKRRELHFMKCPKCGMDPIEIDSRA
jgi:hypothetical protein